MGVAHTQNTHMENKLTQLEQSASSTNNNNNNRLSAHFPFRYEILNRFSTYFICLSRCLFIIDCAGNGNKCKVRDNWCNLCDIYTHRDWLIQFTQSKKKSVAFELKLNSFRAFLCQLKPRQSAKCRERIKKKESEWDVYTKIKKEREAKAQVANTFD